MDARLLEHLRGKFRRKVTDLQCRRVRRGWEHECYASLGGFVRFSGIYAKHGKATIPSPGPSLASAPVGCSYRHRGDQNLRNLSSRGFYCFTEAPLVPGEVVNCDITIPSYGASDRGGSLIVCQAEVIRVEAVGTDPGFGVACRILDFTLARDGISFYDN